MPPVNKALALVADTDIADTINVGGAARSFAKGGPVKSTKQKVHYKSGPVTNNPCKSCSMFRAPNSCTAVFGVISPMGHCKLYKPIKKFEEGDEVPGLN